MAFDGITTAALADELNGLLQGGGVSRIVQSEKDELLITIKNRKIQYRLLMSANASLPLIYLTEEKKEAPLTAPNFCMLLRKHLQGGQILRIVQPSLERILIFEIEHRDEMGDLRTKKLIIELMGKHSNIILTDESDTVIDSIKRIPSSVSSVREVLPGRPWFIPDTRGKRSPVDETAEGFRAALAASGAPAGKALYSIYTGLSPLASEEILYEAGVDPRKTPGDLSDTDWRALSEAFLGLMERIRKQQFLPNAVFENGEPKEYAAFPLRMYPDLSARTFSSMSECLLSFYGEKEKITRIRQKSANLRHLITTALERTNKKLAIQEKQMKDTEKKDKFRIYGELLNTYGYEAEPGARSLNVLNYYTGEMLAIPLDHEKTALENAQHYFEKYNKLKRTAEALSSQIEESRADRDQLEACLVAVDLAEQEADLSEIRRELAEYGFAQRERTAKGKVREAKSRPYLYLSSDGFPMYVGRNNYQNEEVSFKIGGGNDWWFHAKGMAGSHVIVKTGGKELPDRTFEEAGALAAWYSRGRKAPKVEIDYTLRKNLRKTAGGKPGFVIYHTNYSLMAEPDISKLRREN